MDKLLELLNKDASLSISELSVMLNMEKSEVEACIEGYKKDGIIKGSKLIIDRERVKGLGVTALVELNVIPQKETGFDEIAKHILQFDEVESLYLMAGSYDLAVYVVGESIQDISMFVSRRLATIEAVTSTATHFLLRRYKELGISMTEEDDKDIRSLTL